jgi:hypothetical protein
LAGIPWKQVLGLEFDQLGLDGDQLFVNVLTRFAGLCVIDVVRPYLVRLSPAGWCGKCTKQPTPAAPILIYRLAFRAKKEANVPRG